jgi:hypothetical protein
MVAEWRSPGGRNGLASVPIAARIVCKVCLAAVENAWSRKMSEANEAVLL